jgi:hypothetical protein
MRRHVLPTAPSLSKRKEKKKRKDKERRKELVHKVNTYDSKAKRKGGEENYLPNNDTLDVLHDATLKGWTKFELCGNQPKGDPPKDSEILRALFV